MKPNLLEPRVEHLDGPVAARGIVRLDTLPLLKGRWELLNLVPGAKILGAVTTFIINSIYIMGFYINVIHLLMHYANDAPFQSNIASRKIR